MACGCSRQAARSGCAQSKDEGAAGKEESDDLSSSEEECYDLCYDNVSNGGASRHLEYDEKMEQQFSGSQYANVTDFSNMY